MSEIEMVERVARAIISALDRAPAAYVKETVSESSKFHSEFYVCIDGPDFDMLAVARAAIEAMREPTEEMKRGVYRYSADDRETWRALIDAALSPSVPLQDKEK